MAASEQWPTTKEHYELLDVIGTGGTASVQVKTFSILCMFFKVCNIIIMFSNFLNFHLVIYSNIKFVTFSIHRLRSASLETRKLLSKE